MKPEQLRARALAEWRGMPEPLVLADRGVPVADAVRKVMSALGLKERLNAEEVIGAWQGIVGDFVAKHSAPHSLKDGVLHVRVLQPTVLYELDRVWKRDILGRLKSRFGSRVVREIKFRIG
jgi:predicted nucleic acid-binding Zn ribbon protein